RQAVLPLALTLCERLASLLPTAQLRVSASGRTACRAETEVASPLLDLGLVSTLGRKLLNKWTMRLSGESAAESAGSCAALLGYSHLTHRSAADIDAWVLLL